MHLVKDVCKAFIVRQYHSVGASKSWLHTMLEAPSIYSRGGHLPFGSQPYFIQLKTGLFLSELGEFILDFE